MIIRPETSADIDAIFAVNTASFPTDAEAKLVDRLRDSGCVSISLVAEAEKRITGHICFSPVSLNDHASRGMLGLAPMAVITECQRTGVGSALVRAGLDACQDHGVGAVVVLGHAGYYPRFGFVPASRFGLNSEYDVPDEVFMAQELRAAYLDGKSGTIRYHPAFADM